MKIVTLFLFTILFIGSGFCQKKKATIVIPEDLDIINSTFKGYSFSELSIDLVTDLLGRPDLVSEHAELKGRITLDYYSKGICFIFVKSKELPAYVCYGFYIYLIEYRNDKFKTFSPFTGKISRGVSGLWKKKDFLKIFEDFNEIFYEDEKGFARDKEFYIWTEKYSSSKFSRPFPSLEIRKKDFVINFYYDDVTMFLREIEVWKNFKNLSK